MSETGLIDRPGIPEPRPLLEESFSVLDEAYDTHRPVAAFTLFSGGHDSLTSAAVAFDWASQRGVELSAAHICTGIGIPDTTQFVRDTCEAQGWPLKVYEPPVPYEEIVGEYGFPGPGQHGLMYQRLKERCLRQLVRDHKGDDMKNRVMFVTGVRSEESVRRMRHVERIQREGAQVWAADIWNWTKLDCNREIERRGLPRNPVVDMLHMSGECLPAGELISTPGGWRRLGDIRAGDLVHGLTQSGKVNPQYVAKKHDNGTKDLIELAPSYLRRLTVTPDHKLYVRRRELSSHPYKVTLGAPEWRSAAEVVDAHGRESCYLLARPFRTLEGDLGLSEDQLRFLGYFIAEGGYVWRKDAKKPSGVIFTVSLTNSREMAAEIEGLLTRLVGRAPHRREYEDGRWGKTAHFVSLRIMDAAFVAWLRGWITGRYAPEKSFNDRLLTGRIDQQRLVLDAMWEGDGSEFISRRRVHRSYSTSSVAMALQVQEMLLRRGEVFGLNRQTVAPSARVRNARVMYQVRRTVGAKLTRAVLEPGVLWVQVPKARVVPPEPVYDLTIEGDPNYLTAGGLVHNCLCGAFAKPGEIKEIEGWFPEVAERIHVLEGEIFKKGLRGCVWGQRPPRVHRDQMKIDFGEGWDDAPAGMLCTTCEADASEGFELDDDAAA